MQSLGYTRNIHAVHLSKGFSDMIGVVLPSVNLPYFADLVAGIAEAAEASGVHLSLYQTDYQEQKNVLLYHNYRSAKWTPDYLLQSNS